jgi:predicted TIM-barrel fold metal-dependent hydrolase
LGLTRETLAVRADCSSVRDETIDKDIPIIDCHHHLWVHDGTTYLLPEFSAELASGHNVIATVYVECNYMYRDTGPVPLRSVGEAEFVARVFAENERSKAPTAVCAGFVGAADLALGAEVETALDALATGSNGLLRGVRGFAAWDEDPSINTGVRPYAPRGLLRTPRFREGFAKLASRELTYDGWQYHPQLDDLCDLADAFPNTPIVVDHCGGLVRIARYANEGNFEYWRSQLASVARRPNTFVKMGGLAPRRCGFAYATREPPPTAVELANDWGPYIETCIELFGPERCMFESNFPVDRVAGSYHSVWNAFKICVSSMSRDEKLSLFCNTARDVYRLN